MALPITELKISTSSEQEEQFKAEGFTNVSGNLYRTAKLPPAYLWYKQGSTGKPMTRIHMTGRRQKVRPLQDAGFTEIAVNLGTDANPIYLWYMSGTTKWDVPIVDLKVTTRVEDEPELVLSGWERLGCDLYLQPTDNPVHIWAKRNGPRIGNIGASIIFTDDAGLFEQGFHRVDKSFNRKVKPRGSLAFLWYQHSPGVGGGMCDIDVSLNQSEECDLLAKGFTRVEKNLNADSVKEPMYAWYQPAQTGGITFLTLLVGERARQIYEEAQIRVVGKNLNLHNSKPPVYIAYK